MARERNLEDAVLPAAIPIPEAEVDDIDDPSIAELANDGDVDGDYNGAPELAALEESQGWNGVDALDAMRGRDAQAANLADEEPAAQLAASLEEQRAQLVERLVALRENPSPDAEPGEAGVAAALEESIERITEALERLEPDGEAPA